VPSCECERARLNVCSLLAGQLSVDGSTLACCLAHELYFYSGVMLMGVWCTD